MTATRQIVKGKKKRVIVVAYISNETSLARVTRSCVKHQNFDGGDQSNIETLFASLVVELSIFRVGEMLVFTSKKSLANSSFSRRATHSKTRALPQQSSHSLPTYMNLRAKDTQPPTSPAEVGSDLD